MFEWERRREENTRRNDNATVKIIPARVSNIPP